MSAILTVATLIEVTMTMVSALLAGKILIVLPSYTMPRIPIQNINSLALLYNAKDAQAFTLAAGKLTLM